MNSTLEIKQLILPMYFGVTDEERAVLQDIEFNISINFHKVPKACNSDKIEDALCYDKLVQGIKIFCKSSKFHLIEHLSFALHQYIKDKFQLENDVLTLQICKFSPVAEIKDKCCFEVKA
jgi:dihydroneopterin aldolase